MIQIQSKLRLQHCSVGEKNFFSPNVSSYDTAAQAAATSSSYLRSLASRPRAWKMLGGRAPRANGILQLFLPFISKSHFQVDALLVLLFRPRSTACAFSTAASKRHVCVLAGPCLSAVCSVARAALRLRLKKMEMFSYGRRSPFLHSRRVGLVLCCARCQATQ